MYTLILKLSHLDIVHRVFVALIAVTVCLRAGVTVFVSTVCISPCHKDEYVNLVLGTFKAQTTTYQNIEIYMSVM